MLPPVPLSKPSRTLYKSEPMSGDELTRPRPPLPAMIAIVGRHHVISPSGCGCWAWSGLGLKKRMGAQVNNKEIQGSTFSMLHI